MLPDIDSIQNPFVNKGVLTHRTLDKSEDKIDNTENFLTSVHFNLKSICPKLLLYSESYLKFQNNIHVLSYNPNVLKDLNKIPLFDIHHNKADLKFNLLMISNYLAFNIFVSFLRESFIVEKDMEDYYQSNMLATLKKLNYLKDIPLGVISSYWYMILRTLNFLKDKVKEYDKFFPLYDIYYTDHEHNYKDTIPILGINKDQSISLTYFMVMKDSSSFITGNYIDIIRIPSLCKTILYFTQNSITIKDITIIWLPYADSFKFHKYISAKYKNIQNTELLNYLSQRYQSSFKKHHTVDPQQCYTCPYWTECVKDGNILQTKTTNIKVL